MNNQPAPPSELRCESMVNPIGLDARPPRLSWIVNDPRRGAVQSAYQIVAEVNGNAWDSGKVASSQSVHIPFSAVALKSRDLVTWKVRTWDAADVASEFSAPATFEMGLLDRSDWSAKWIQSPIVGGPYTIPPVPYLRKSFTLRGDVARARLYISALGQYECEINGRVAHDFVFAPGRFEYERRVAYHTVEVTSQLHKGENVIGALLGDGWYTGHLHSDPRQRYGDRPKLLAQLEITFTDGTTQTISTDETWRAGEGPIRGSDHLMGEDYDARLDIPGWSKAGFDDSKWRTALLADVPSIEISAHRAPPVRKKLEIKPIAPPVRSANGRRHIFDMGQNMVGWVRLKMRDAKPGQTIDLRYVEMLDKDGKPYTAALRSARATDHYTTRGGGEEVFEPRFTFHGFRYVEVRDFPGRNPTVDDITGIVIHSDTPPTGEFECSDPLINQLQSNIVWSQRGNFIDIPTDCPQRDERLGWTGDAQVFVRTASFNMDVANFFHKWLADMADTQALAGDGRIHSVIPGVKTIHHEGGPAWADAAVICPWVIYLCYGDTKILSDRWDMMTKFMQFLANTCPGHVRADESLKWRGYGDWLNMNALTPPDLIGIAFYAYDATLMSKMARVLGKEDEATKYAKLFEDVRAVWQSRYVNADGSLKVQTQTAHVLALHFDLLNEQDRPAAVDALVKDIEERGMHLSTGFVGTPYLNHVLTRFGRGDVAYQLLLQKTFPSWLFPVTHGATTMWERWDGWTPEKGFNDAGMNSYNHYAYGAVGEWMYAKIAGIDLDEQTPGYKHIVVRPLIASKQLRATGGGLTWARASLKSIYGLIKSHWKLDGDKLQLNVTIPANTTATITIPRAANASVTGNGRAIAQADGVSILLQDGDSITVKVGAGEYSFGSAVA